MKNKFIFITFLVLKCFVSLAQENNKTTPDPIIIDPGDGNCVWYYVDADEDGWGGPNRECIKGGLQIGYSTTTGDCDDSDPDQTVAIFWFLDNDQDGYGGVKSLTKTCIAPPNHVYLSGDCDDNDPAVTLPRFWYSDYDGDGFGGAITSTKSCVPPHNFIGTGGDCNDNQATINPNIMWYADADSDGFGDPSVSLQQCTQPVGYVNNNLDLCPNESYSYGNGCIRFTNENYVYTRTFNKPVANSSLPISKKDISESITYFDGLGRTKQTIAIGQGPSNKIGANLTDWQTSWTLGNGAVSNFNLNGSAAENRRINGTNPFGDTSVLWECGSDAGNDDDGGWNTNPIAVDKNVAYRYSVWVKRTGNIDGYGHHGTLNVLNLAGVADPNPYFWLGDTPELDKWYLIIGIVHPASYTGGDTGVSGLYDTDGNKVMDGDEFKWDSAATTSVFRSYFYYATDLNAKQYFYNPILQKIDGSNSSLSALTSDFSPGDIVTHAEYDAMGRQAKEFLPYNVNKTLSGKIYTNPTSDVSNFYNTPKYENTLNPYSEKLYDDSPLNRVLEQGAPGNSWKAIAGNDTDNTVKFENQFNSVSDKVKIYKVTTSSIPQDAGYYVANELNKNVVKNENWKPTQVNLNDNTEIEFKDKLGTLLLKRLCEKGKWHDTYYIYDDLGNLSFVLPPLVNTYANDQQIWAEQNYYAEEIDSFYSVSYSGYNDCDISLYNNTLNFYFSNYGDGPNVVLNTSTTLPALDLNFNPPLPDMILGPVTIKKADGSYSSAHYTAKIQNGDVYLTGDGTNTPAYGVLISATIDLGTLTSNLGIVLDNTTLNDLAYQYKYDERKRLVEKKLPGKEWEYVVYDKFDRAILTQDANLRAQNKWLFTKYDVFNRVTYTGVWTNPAPNQSRLDVQNAVNTQTTPVWNETKLVGQANLIDGTTIMYSNASFPKNASELKLFTIQYYDNYDFDLVGLVSELSFGVTPTINTKSLVTGSKIKVLETNAWTTTVSYYDEKARTIFTASNNAYLGSTDKVKMKLDFTGKVLETLEAHSKGTTIVSVRDVFTYDHAGRLLTQKQQINNQQEQLIVKNTYDELGRLAAKNVGGKTSVIGEQGLQKVDFNYNIRGWMKDINSLARMENDLFAFHLNYEGQNEPYPGGPGKPLFNGNISSASWKTDNVSSALKTYYYQYDNLNRLTNTVYQENEVINNKFVETIGQYDRNGNIGTMTRNMQSTANPLYAQGIDQLSYKYKGNQLLSVADAYGFSSEGFKDGNVLGDDYTYDANGNLKTDKNKKITSIEYNHLNLPVKLIFNNADVTAATPQVIEYKYDATGVKLEKIVRESNSVVETQYAGSYIYEKTNTAPIATLQFFSQPQGYVANNGGVYSYVFQYTDHLGNIRLSYADSNNDDSIAGVSTEVYSDDFESGNGWNSQGFSWGQAVTSYDNVKKHSGNLSGKIEKPTTGEWIAHSNTWVTINNAQPTDYIFSGWIYSDGPSADIFMFKSNAAETGYPASFDYIGTSEKNRWVYVEKRVTVPAIFTKLNLRIDNNGGGTVWFDDVSIRRVNPTNEIVEENNYYPFGLKHKGDYVTGNGNHVGNKYKFNGKELQDELGLNMYDYGARNYDPAIGRWMNIDPLAEKMTNHSTYNFCFNNPIKFVDPDGRQPFDEWRQRADGSFDWVSDLGRKEGLDVIHYTQGKEKGKTLITDHQGNEQWMKAGSDVINGFESRDKSVDYADVFNEFKIGYGPKRSLFDGDHPMTIDMKDSYAAFLGRSLYMDNGGKKGYVGYDFGLSGVVRAGTDMTEQMIGSCGISIYPIGDNVVFMLTDTKTPKSLFYHLPGVSSNYDRDWNGQGILMPYSETKQTYIWIEKVNTLKTMYKKQSNEIQDHQRAMSIGL